jgi:hypothetical protein
MPGTSGFFIFNLFVENTTGKQKKDKIKIITTTNKIQGGY